MIKQYKFKKHCKFCNEIFSTNLPFKIFCSTKCEEQNAYHLKKKPLVKKICPMCKKEFLSSFKLQIYCNKKCASQSYLISSGRISLFKHLPTASVGAISELIIGADLLKKGYEVYRPLSASCSADLMIEKNNKIMKIEVRTVYESKDNRISYPKQNIRAPILAMVVLNNKDKIIYLQMVNKKEIIL